MSFKMIREAQALARLGSKAKVAQTVQRIIGVDSVIPIAEAFDQKEFEVTPAHYNQWLATINEIGAERGVNLSKRQNFNDIAFEILDNDSLVDALGGNAEQTKLNILKALWQAQQVSKAHTRVQDHVKSVIDKTREEEEAVDSLVGSDEDEESGFGQALATAQGVEQEERSAPRVGRQPIFQHSLRKGKKNPYPVGSLRAALWQDAHGVEDEEFDDEMPADDEFADEQQPEVDTAAMSPDDLASHITGGEGGDDLEARVDDLEDRIADLEHDQDDEPVGDLPPDEGSDLPPEEGADDEVLPSPVDKPAPRANVVEKGFDEEEQVKSLFHKAITSPKEHMSAALKDVEAEGTKAWAGLQMPKNPHPKNSPAYTAWAKGFKASAKAAMGLNDKPRESTSKHRSKKK